MLRAFTSYPWYLDQCRFVRTDTIVPSTPEVNVPLSEHEQRVLEQMEQALYADDPRLASQLRRPASQGAPGGLDRRRLALGVLIALGGLALVVVGVMTQMIWIGVVGFLLMVGGGAWAATPSRTGKAATLGVVGKDGSVTRGAPKGQPRGKGPRQPRSGTFMDRMEQRWDKRKEQGPS